MKNITVIKNEGNGAKTALVIPQSMSGAALQAFKNNNKSLLASAKEQVLLTGSAVVLDSDLNTESVNESDEGDRFRRERVPPQF